MQRQQCQAQMETLTNLGAAQVAKTTYDTRDFQTKAFSREAAAILDWAEDRYDRPISESHPASCLKGELVDMANFNMPLHGEKAESQV